DPTHSQHTLLRQGIVKTGFGIRAVENRRRAWLRRHLGKLRRTTAPVALDRRGRFVLQAPLPDHPLTGRRNGIGASGGKPCVTYWHCSRPCCCYSWVSAGIGTGTTFRTSRRPRDIGASILTFTP